MVKRIGLIVTGMLAALWLVLLISGNQHIFYGLRKTYLLGKKTPDIDDMPYFDVRKISKSNAESTLIYSRYNRMSLRSEDQLWSDSMETTALLLYWRDSLVYEQYNECNISTLSNSFSMAKSITSVLIGKAIEEGFIESIDDRVGRYLDGFNQGADTLLTIRHLLEMTSGIPFGESYNSPLGYMAKAYFGKNLEEATRSYHVQETPGKKWAYEGGNTTLLGLILKRATGMSVSDYCASRLWGPIGAENDAFWNLDHENGIEKTFSGFYATARDFARVGLLYMHEGVHHGDTIISPQWVRQSITPHYVADEKGEACSWYGRQWWMGQHEGHSFFLCRGLRGQYVVCVPEKELVLVRLGHTQDKARVNHMPADLYRYIDMAMYLAPTN
jgi:CubicO group peptidase (beta-lactamase class C family)